MIADKMEDLLKTQVEAIKNLSIDKITVWDSMNGKDGGSTTSDFIKSYMSAVPPMNEMFRMAGMELPGFMGKPVTPAPQPARPASEEASHGEA